MHKVWLNCRDRLYVKGQRLNVKVQGEREVDSALKVGQFLITLKEQTNSKYYCLLHCTMINNISIMICIFVITMVIVIIVLHV